MTVTLTRNAVLSILEECLSSVCWGSHEPIPPWSRINVLPPGRKRPPSRSRGASNSIAFSTAIRSRFKISLPVEKSTSRYGWIHPLHGNSCPEQPLKSEIYLKFEIDLKISKNLRTVKPETRFYSYGFLDLYCHCLV